MSLAGNGHKQALHFTRPPQRVVSLVPSMTESLFDLGLGGAVVGITDYCVHPAQALQGLPRLGGPKNPDVAQIIALRPDLVLANQEENTPAVVQQLEQAGIKVWVTFPKTARQAVDVLWALVGIFNSKAAALRLETLEMALDWAESALAERQTRRYFCPIWHQPAASPEAPAWWMTFNQDTYIHDVLRLMGGENIFAGRQRLYPLAADLGLQEAEPPGERDRRYPRVRRDEVLAANPQVILLPSEPFPFGEADCERFREAFAETEAAQTGRILTVDGSLLTWHGTRLARALRDLPSLLEV